MRGAGGSQSPEVLAESPGVRAGEMLRGRGQVPGRSGKLGDSWRSWGVGEEAELWG